MLYRKNSIKKIYSYLDKADSRYGVYLLFEFSDGSCLFFHFGEFIFFPDKDSLQEKYKLDWKEVDYKNTADAIYIADMKEDENTSYFILLSNSDIIYIYHWIVGNLDDWYYTFEIVGKSNENYQEVYKYMHEDFIESPEVRMYS